MLGFSPVWVDKRYNSVYDCYVERGIKKGWVVNKIFVE